MVDISSDDMAKAREQMRAAWRAANPDASDAEMPAALQPEPKQHTGFLVALWLHPATAAQLAVPGGEAAEALHITLCYCGDPAELADPDLTVARAISRIESLVSYREPLEGKVAGYGRFAASDTSDGRDVFYASIDIPGLEALRQDIAQELQWAGLPPRTTHGFTPHCTLAYLEPGDANPVASVPQLLLRFAAITIMAAERRIDIPLRGFGPMLYSTAEKGGAWRLFVEQPQTFAVAPEWINVLPTPGVYTHAQYGAIVITEERNQRFVANFEARVYQQDLPITIDIEHDGKMAGAIGYIAAMRANPNGSVDARITWTDRGRTLVEEDRFRYFSPEWWEVWTDPVDGQAYRDVMIGGAICVRPFFKEDALAPLVASEGQWFAAKPGASGPYPEMVRLAAATTKEDSVSDTTTALTEEQAQRFADLERTLAEREQAFAEQAKQVEALEAAKVANEAKVADLERERRERKFTDTVMGRGGEADGAVWPGAIKDNVADLVALAEAVGEDSPVFTNHVARMNEAAATLKASEAFRPLGTTERDEGGSAWARIEQKAKALTDADPTLTHAQAVTQVMEREPKLYAEAEAEG